MRKQVNLLIKQIATMLINRACVFELLCKGNRCVSHFVELDQMWEWSNDQNE